MIHIYLHIGTHKTGTTTIQQTLRTLAEKDPKPFLFFKPDIPIMTAFARATRYDDVLVKKFQRDIKQLIRRNKRTKKIVLSNENLCGSSSNGYLNSNFVYSMLRDVTAGFKVTVVIYLRRQDSIVESMYTQMIHEGSSMAFEDFFRQYDSPDALNYDRMLQELASCFEQKDIVVKSYHGASQKGLLADFGQVIQCPQLQSAKEEIRNPSYCRHAVEIAKICNTALDREAFKKNKKRRLRLALQNSLPKLRNEPFDYLTDNARTKFLKKYQASNQAVADRFFNGNMEALFPAPMPTAPGSCKQQSLTYNEVTRLLLYLLQEQEDEINFRLLQERLRSRKRKK